MSEVIVITSGKGGTGKTTTTGAIGSYLAAAGKRVLCLDGDMELKNLDLVLGMTDLAVMDFNDVLNGSCSLDEAAVESPRVKGLFLLTAPVNTMPEDVDTEKMGELITQIRESFDYCLIDSPAGLGAGFRLSAMFAVRAIVVATGEASALRDVQRVVMELRTMGMDNIRLVVNRVRPGFMHRLHTTIDDAIDITGAQLIGVVPEDNVIPVAANFGKPLSSLNCGRAAVAFDNIANRIAGGEVPLMKIK